MNYLRCFTTKYPRIFTRIIIICLIVFLLIKRIDNPPFPVIGALIALIAAMMAHHSAFASIAAQKEKDEKLSKIKTRNVMLRAKLFSSEFLSYVEHRKHDIGDNLTYFRENELVPLNVILQYRIKIPVDFNYILESVDRIDSKDVLEAMSKISYLSGQINHFVENINDGVELNMRYIEKINNVMAEGYTLNIPIKDLERIDYWLTILKESANRMYDAMKKQN